MSLKPGTPNTDVYTARAALDIVENNCKWPFRVRGLKLKHHLAVTIAQLHDLGMIKPTKDAQPYLRAFIEDCTKLMIEWNDPPHGYTEVTSVS